MDTQLLPCPFCGGEATEDRIEPHKHPISYFPDYPGTWCVECVPCEFRRFSHMSRDEAAAAWNQRDALSPSDPAGAPEGWKVVPVEPTPEMIDAAGESIYGHPRHKAVEWAKEDKFESCAFGGVEAYRVMLAAAPVAPAAPETNPSHEEVFALLTRAVREIPASISTQVWQVTPIQVAWVIGMLRKMHPVAPAAVAPQAGAMLRHDQRRAIEWALGIAPHHNIHKAALRTLLAADAPAVVADAVAPSELRPAKSHCQNGGDVCLAGNRDGVCCPEDSCDIDDGVRKNPIPAEQPDARAAWPWKSTRTDPPKVDDAPQHFSITVLGVVDDPRYRFNDEPPFVDVVGYWPALNKWTVTHCCVKDEVADDVEVNVTWWMPRPDAPGYLSASPGANDAR
jgi:hypothetical protein